MLAQQMKRLAFEAGEGQDVTNASLQEVEQIFDQTLHALLDEVARLYEADSTVKINRLCVIQIGFFIGITNDSGTVIENRLV